MVLINNKIVTVLLVLTGADKYRATAAGVFPIDSAINAGRTEEDMGTSLEDLFKRKLHMD